MCPNRERKTMNFQIKQAVPADGQAIGDLMQEIWAEMAHKEWYVPDDGPHVTALLEEGKAIAFLALAETDGGEAGSGEAGAAGEDPAAEAGGVLAGAFLAVLPGRSEENLGREYGLSEGELDLAAHMDSVAVRKAFRGFGLQHRLMEVTEEALAAKGIRYLFCTAHPENTYSQNNIRSLGYEAFLQKDMYGGYRRDLFIKCI